MKYSILNTYVNSTSYEEATGTIVKWARDHESRYICAANVHMIMEAYDSPDFQEIVNNADLVTPDGMPLVWAMRRLGSLHQQRVYGPDLMLEVLAKIDHPKTPIGFLGGSPDVLEHMVGNLKTRFPSMNVTYRFSPPFRPLSPEEDRRIVEDLNTSGARILFVGLGCPKQERWMAAHKDNVRAVMLGVGAAFDFHSGNKRQAPKWMQAIGLEWLFRFAQEPQRLWRRYLVYNSRFMVLILGQLLGSKTDKVQR